MHIITYSYVYYYMIFIKKCSFYIWCAPARNTQAYRLPSISQQAHTIGENSKNVRNVFFGPGNCDEVISESIGSCDPRSKKENRLISRYYGLERSRAKNINYFLFYMNYKCTNLHHTLRVSSHTRNYAHTHIYEPGIVALHRGTRLQTSQLVAYNISKQFRRLPRHTYLGHFSLFIF